MSIWTDKDGRVHAAIMRDNKRIHRTLPKGATARDAKLVEAELTKALGRKQVHIPGDPALSKILDLYATHANTLRSPKTAQYHAARLHPWLTGQKASDAQSVAARFIKDCTGSYKPATINRSLGALKTALTIAWKEGMTPEDYGAKISRIPENNARHEYLSIAEVKKLSDACTSEPTRAAIWIALLTGCRRGEILALQKSDIGPNHITIKSGNTKTLRERVVPIIPAVRPWLELVPLAVNFEGLKSGFRRAREAAGMEHINYHDLRHSCASLLINMGTPLEVVRDILGHTTVKTTERYAHLDVSKQAEALGRLSAAVGAIAPTITPAKKQKNAIQK